MKYSAIVQPEYGAIYCNDAGSDARLATTTVYFIASFARNNFTIRAIQPYAYQLIHKHKLQETLYFVD